MNPTKAEILVYVGTYTLKMGHVSGKAEGIYVYRMNPRTGTLKLSNQMTGVVNPSYLTIHPNHHFLYAVNELDHFAGQPGGGVSAFRIDAHSGALSLLNQQPTFGGAPCHLVVDKTGKFLMVANYLGGNVAVYPLQDDGEIGMVCDLVQHPTDASDPQHKKVPHAHSVNLDPAHKYTLVADLGLDKVFIYRLYASNGKLFPHDVPSVSLKPGAGPRHLDFHPNGRYVYVINELNSTLTAFTYDSKLGTLSEIHTLSTLPEGFKGRSACADIHVHPSGKYVYGSNRGHNSIVAYAIDPASGALTCIGHEPTQGDIPRNFAIDPSGSFLLAANQDSDTIVTFHIDPSTGKLESTGQTAMVPSPVCIKFLSLSA
jgi:6-phosphogluconolactonase